MAGEDGRGNGLWPTQLWSIYINHWAAKSELGRKPPDWELAKNRLTVVRLWACVLKVLLIWMVFRTFTENLPGECFQSLFSWSLLLLCSSQLILWEVLFDCLLVCDWKIFSVSLRSHLCHLGALCYKYMSATRVSLQRKTGIFANCLCKVVLKKKHLKWYIVRSLVGFFQKFLSTFC